MKHRGVVEACLVAAVIGSFASSASAFPGFFAYKGGKPINRSTHVVLMMKDSTTVVTVMPDYEGDLKPFVVVMPVPDDVKVDQVRTLRRDFVDRVDGISAPRFHEFWEMDPCEEGKQEQEWERDLSVHGGGFLGMDFSGGEGDAPKFKPSKEMSLTVDTDFKEGDEKYQLVSAADGADIAGYLKRKGFTAPDGANQAVAPYVKAGMSFLVTEVETKKIELVGGDRAIISPIRYVTNKPVNVASTLGLLNLGDKQELFVYVLHPEQRFEVKNYANTFPPTNVEVDFKVKERMGEFYAGLHDLMLKKDPMTILDEFAWPTKGCGEPCPNEPLMIHELLSLGGDVFEESVPKDEAHPKAPEMTDEEKAKFKELKTPEGKVDKKMQKEIEKMRTETARRKALVSRHHYILSRMHHRYDKSTLPKDLEVGPAQPVHGGIDIPQGEKATLPTDVKPAADNRFQVRFISYHPSPAVPHCEKPERYRWGKAPRTYRGLRKIWIAQDMATKNRGSYKPAELVFTPIPTLALAGQPNMLGGQQEIKSFAPVPSASAAPGDGTDAAAKKGCGCRVPASSPRGGSAPALAALAVFATAIFRRVRARRAS